MDYSIQIFKGRKKKGLTQAELAKEIGITPRYLQAIEAGQYFPSREVFKKICNTLEITINLSYEPKNYKNF